MGVLELILLGVRSVATLLNNPNIGGSNVNANEAAELLGLLATLVEEGDDALDDLKQFTDEVKAMVEQNRGPTPTEWDNLRARQQAAHDRLQAVKEELLGEEEEEDSDPEPDPDPDPPADPEPEEPVNEEPVSEAEPEAPEEPEQPTG